MFSRGVNLLIRAIRPAQVGIWMVVACTSVCAKAADDPTPGAKEGTSTIAATPVKSEAPAAGRSRADCERYVAALLGRGNRELLDTVEVRDVARSVPDLVVCGAVLTDSDELCKQPNQDPSMCEKSWSALHELRSNPKGRGFVFPEREYKGCSADEAMAPFCDDIRAAAKSGDPSKCPTGKGKMGPLCRALVSLDKSQCNRAMKEDHPEDPKIPKDWCVEMIEFYAPFAKGLEALAKSGPSLQRNLAKAALGQGDACAEYEKRAMKACVR